MNKLDVITAICGITAATIVATGQPQPLFGIAFQIYVISAICAVLSNYQKKNWPYVVLFSVFFIVDTYGIYQWWPW